MPINVLIVQGGICRGMPEISLSLVSLFRPIEYEFTIPAREGYFPHYWFRTAEN